MQNDTSCNVHRTAYLPHRDTLIALTIAIICINYFDVLNSYSKDVFITTFLMQH